MRRTLTFDAIRDLLEIEKLDLPKYAPSLLNLANRYAQGTRPRSGQTALATDSHRFPQIRRGGSWPFPING